MLSQEIPSSHAGKTLHIGKGMAKNPMSVPCKGFKILRQYILQAGHGDWHLNCYTKCVQGECAAGD